MLSIKIIQNYKTFMTTHEAGSFSKQKHHRAHTYAHMSTHICTCTHVCTCIDTSKLHMYTHASYTIGYRFEEPLV